ncbi:hypothetical protein D3C75_754390 [compost metagenome]
MVGAIDRLDRRPLVGCGQQGRFTLAAAAEPGQGMDCRDQQRIGLDVLEELVEPLRRPVPKGVVAAKHGVDGLAQQDHRTHMQQPPRNRAQQIRRQALSPGIGVQRPARSGADQHRQQQQRHQRTAELVNRGRHPLGGQSIARRHHGLGQHIGRRRPQEQYDPEHGCLPPLPAVAHRFATHVRVLLVVLIHHWIIANHSPTDARHSSPRPATGPCRASNRPFLLATAHEDFHSARTPTRIPP